MTTIELSQKELIIYHKVCSFQGTMDEKTEQIKVAGLFEQYKEIHNQYLALLKANSNQDEGIEALKRMIFLNWYHMIEPSCFTGIWELSGDTIHASYSILNQYLRDQQIDQELKWMLSYYAASDWSILVFSEGEMPELTEFVKSVEQIKNHLPSKKALQQTMNQRGQMGEYFKGLIQ